MSRVMWALYVVGAVFAAVGVYVALNFDKFIGAGMVLVASFLFILPYTRQRY